MALGGTILSSYQQESQSVVQGVTGTQLLEPLLENSAIEIVLEEYTPQIPGPQLTVEYAIEVATKIEQIQHQYEGVVVLQGTDTLEEFSYLVQLITSASIPIVFTGAMKSHNEMGFDGLGNTYSAIKLASSDHAEGVYVVFNDYIFDPSDVSKMHATNLSAFQAPNKGPLGVFILGEPHLYSSRKKQIIYEKKVEPKVELIKASFGSSNALLEHCIEQGVKGIVIEGFGSGNVPAEWEKSIEKAISKKIPIIITSRCSTGSAIPMYEYIGGGKRLKKLGAFFATHMSGTKAKIKLMVLLGQSEFSIDNLERYW